MKDRDILIGQGYDLLSRVHQKDVFNCGSLENVVSDEDAESFEHWRLSVKACLFGTPLFDEFQNLEWIVNGNRVSVERVNKIIELLKIN